MNSLRKTFSFFVTLLLPTLLLFWGARDRALAQDSTSISSDGVIEARSGGLRFPDGTLQSTAAAGAEETTDALESARGLSASQGLYDNRIPDFAHSLAFVEICFRDGALLVDQNAAGDDTTGGDCSPGDVGWILEQDNRAETDWTSAKATCLQHGMRLPEIWEIHFSCRHQDAIGLLTSVDRNEWTSNTPRITGRGGGEELVAQAVTKTFQDCDLLLTGSIALPPSALGENATWSFRCAL